MFFAQPFILASDFIQHVMLIVLCGMVALEYCMQPRGRHGSFTVVSIIPFIAAAWIITEYFVPVRSVEFQFLVHMPLVFTLLAFLYRIPVRSLSPPLRYTRAAIAALSLCHAGIDLAYALRFYAEPLLFHSIVKTIEVFGLYGFVLTRMRHRAVSSVSPRVSVSPLSLLRRAGVIAVLFLSMATHASAFSLTTRIGDQSTEVKAGDRIYFDVEIKWPENDRRQDLRIEYQIIDGGNVIASEKVLRAVETQASFLDYIVLPQSATPGNKELNVVIQTYDQSLSEHISATFDVEKSGDRLLVYFMILSFAIGLVVLLVIIQLALIMRARRVLGR